MILYKDKLLLVVLLACVGHLAFGNEIINGEKAKPDSLPYMASLQVNGKHRCGGFVISNDFVLTAAHCDVKKTYKMTVVLGTNNIRKADRKRKTHKVVKKCKHPDFKTVLLGNDIMLLKLSGPAKVTPVLLPKRKGFVKANTECLVAGWGYIKTNGTAQDELRKVNVTTDNLKKCQQRWKYSLPAKILCAGGDKTDKGFCQGDSGGPLVCNEIAVGIVSFNFNRDCDYSKRSNVPNVYTDISMFLPWINGILRKGVC